MKRSIRSASGVMALAAFVVAWTAAASAQESPHGNIKVPCEKCHTATSWTTMRVPSGFDHGSTRFPLTGQHAALQCRGCHPSLKFSPTSQQCARCHNDIHRGELGLLCERCHTPESWLIPDMVQRHTQTRFPLYGAHRTTACSNCHPNQEKQEYVGLPSECYGCHRQDFEATLSPAHIPAGFSTECAACHRIEAISWSGSFNHSVTAFPLTGAHQVIPCVRCHPGNTFKGAPKDCYQCHQQDYAGAQNPPHATSGFPTACASCHSTSAWQPATFDHNTTRFPLTGAHRSVPCADCHKNGQYAGTPTLCSSCHQQDFTATTNPPHAASGFPTTCESCHSTSAWVPSTFQHDTYFPISAGSRHSPGRWTVCADCHPSVGDFKVFACITCHAHAQATVDPKHSGVRNYQYTNQACYSCHPRGST